MSDRTQDLKNLRAVATRCKNYVDETKEQILWQVGQYDITTQDDNTTAYQKIVPTGATRVKIKSIGGMSYKSENLIVLKSVNAVNNCSVVIGDDGLITITVTNVSSTAACKFDIETIALASGSSYTANVFPIDIPMANASAMYLGVEGNQSAYSIGGQSESYQAKTITGSTVQPNLLYFYYNATVTTTQVFKFKPMLVSGSTAPTEYKQGFTGIRDSVVTSVKSYDSNNNLIDTFTIPSNIQALEGYGRGINNNCYNVLDLETKAFTDKDRVVDLGTGNYTVQYNSFYSYSFQNYAYQQGQVKFLCSAYKEFNYNGSLADFTATDKNITFTAKNMVWITDKQYGTDTTTFKNNASGVKLQHELETYNTTNVSQYIDNNVIEVEAGGYLVFENPYGQAVPSNITYRIEVAK